MRSGIFALAAVALLLLSGVAFAQVPQIINYQGRVAVGAVNFDGTGQFKFALVDGGTNTALAAQATAVVDGVGRISSVNVTNGSSGYISPPSVSFSNPPGGGSGAAATAVLSATGAVSTINVTNGGSNYGTPPTVIIAPPPPNYVYYTYWSNDGSIFLGSGNTEPVKAVPLTVTKGLYSVLLGDASLNPGSGPSNIIMTPIPSGVFNNPDVRLRVWFNDGTHGSQLFAPDQRISAVGYAMMAGTVQDGSITSNKMVNGAVGTAQLAANAVTAANIAAGAIGSSQLQPNLNIGGTLTAAAFSGDGSGLSMVKGSIAWQVVSGALQAQPNSAYVANDTAQTIITLPASPSVGDVVQVSGAGSGGWQFVPNSGQAIFTPWIPHDSKRNWASVASSVNGTRLVAAEYGGLIYTSTDSGMNWTPRSGAGTQNWKAVASNDDGKLLVAVVQNGLIYTSSSSGGTWTAQNSGVRNWIAVASSSDGQQLVALEGGGWIFTSPDGGATWNRVFLSNSWIAVASSFDGGKLVAAANNGQVFRGDSSGSWAISDSATQAWTAVASSSDGGKLIAMGSDGAIHTYSGGVWTNRTFGTQSWSSVTSSSDGSALAATTANGQVYTSVDFGATWQASDGNRNWAAIACSSDGKKFVAAVNGGRIYTRSPTLSGGQGTTAQLQYIGNGQWQPLAQSQIANGAVDGLQIASGAVDSTQLANNAVTAAKIAAGAVGSTQLANNAITGANIAAGTIGTSQLANNAVTGTNIAAGAVGPAQLANNAVTGASIAAGTITSDKISVPLSLNSNWVSIVGTTTNSAGLGSWGNGVQGNASNGGAGVSGYSSGTGGAGVYGYAEGGGKAAIWGQGSGSSPAGLFDGNLQVNGNTSVTGTATISGNTDINGSASVSGSALTFSAVYRQMLNLFTENYGVGVQNGVLYERTPYGFAWYRGGSHSNATFDPGTGGTTLMTLDPGGNLVSHGSMTCTETSQGAIHGISYNTGPSFFAGRFDGNVTVNNNLDVTGDKNFKIDHPLDPAGKYLIHSCIESPDRLNVYSGNVTTDASGNAVITLPSYFAAINRDFRYQLTVIGQFAQAIVADEIQDDHFSIKSDKPKVKVSWQVTGVRQDAWARAHPMVNERAKPAGERGTYLHPELFGQPEEKGLSWSQNPELWKRLREESLKKTTAPKR